MSHTIFRVRGEGAPQERKRCKRWWCVLSASPESSLPVLPSLQPTPPPFLLLVREKLQPKWEHASLNIINNHFNSCFTVITKNRKTPICSAPRFSLSLPSFSLIDWLRDGNVPVISDRYSPPVPPPIGSPDKTHLDASDQIYLHLSQVAMNTTLFCFLLAIPKLKWDRGVKK